MIVLLLLIDEQRKFPRAVKRMYKGKFAETRRKHYIFKYSFLQSFYLQEIYLLKIRNYPSPVIASLYLNRAFIISTKSDIRRLKTTLVLNC